MSSGAVEKVTIWLKWMDEDAKKISYELENISYVFIWLLLVDW